MSTTKAPKARQYDLLVMPDADHIGIAVQRTIGNVTEVVATVNRSDLTPDQKKFLLNPGG